MVIYGWNTKVLKEAPFPGFKCPGEQEDAFIVVTASYFHIFWIPVFPYRKKLRIVCPASETEIKPKDVSEEMRGMAKQLKSSVKMPIWMFSGLALFTIAIALFAFSINKNNEKALDFINNPEVSDVYLYKDPANTNGYPYSFLKVANIEEDSIYLQPNSYSYDQRVHKFDKEDAFYNVSFGYHKAEVLRMFQDKEILQVQRNWRAFTGFGREVEYDFSELLEGLEEEEKND